MANPVFVIIQRGVYRHRIVGIYHDEGEAVACADRALGKEPDSYHSMEIIRVPIDQDVEVEEQITKRGGGYG